MRVPGEVIKVPEMEIYDTTSERKPQTSESPWLPIPWPFGLYFCDMTPQVFTLS